METHDLEAVAFLRKVIESNKTVNLGPPPWSNEVLKKEYFRNFLATRAAIQEHPGYQHHQDAEGLATSINVVRSAGEELFAAFQAFRSAAGEDSFWWPARQSEFDEALHQVQSRTFATATAAIALLNHCVASVRHLHETQKTILRRVIGAFKASEEHRLVDAVRNVSDHVRHLSINWHVRKTLTREEMLFLLPSAELIKKDNWTRGNKQDRKFLKTILSAYPQGLDVERLFQLYIPQLKQFHSDFCEQYAVAAEPSLSEYRGYVEFLDRLGSRNNWRLLLEIARKSGADPYQHLGRHLSQAQLTEVMQLPMHSKIQVDRIIELIDTYEACDENLRGELYTLFEAQ